MGIGVEDRRRGVVEGAVEPARVPRMHTAVLSNGLRVVSFEEPEAARTGLAVAYGVGFRSEPEGREGFAHLFEHLMFQGSQRVAQGQFYRHAKQNAGYVNGTTHQDYTEYHQLLPPWDLDRALYFEADRMRAPEFTRETLREQLELVQEEIWRNTRKRPYAGFPWPKAPALLFDDHRNAHDGYGDMNRLAQISLDECAEFFRDWYTPSNAVVAVVGPHAADEVFSAVSRHFEIIPARTPRTPEAAERQALAHDRRAAFTDEEITVPGASISYLLPGPEAGVREYGSFVALAHLISSVRSEDDPQLDSEIGYFGAFDALGPDVLNIVSILDAPEPSAVVGARVDALLTDLSDGELVRGLLPKAVAQLRRRFLTMGGDTLERTRFSVKAMLLFGRPDLLDEIPRTLAELQVEDITRTAARLRAQHRAVVTILPPGHGAPPSTTVSASVTSIDIAAGQDKEAKALAADPRGTENSWVQGTPPAEGSPWFPVETWRIGELTVSVAPDARITPLVELRLRFTAGPFGWASMWDFTALAQQLQTAVELQMRPFSDLEAKVTSQREHVEIAGACDVRDVQRWCAAVGRAHRSVAAVAGDLRPGRTQATPLQLADGIIRKALHFQADAEAVTSRRLATETFNSRTASLVVVGIVEEAVLQEAVLGLDLDSTEPPRAPAATEAVLGQEFRIDFPAETSVEARYFAEPRGGISEGARYLAVALFGGSPYSRVHANALLAAAQQDETGFVARSMIGGTQWMATRLCLPEHRLDTVSGELDRVLQTLVNHAPSAAEVRQVARYCVNELRSIQDSPAGKADHIAQLVARGVKPATYMDVERGLLDIAPEEVHAVFTTILSGPRATVRLRPLGGGRGAEV